MFRKKLTVLFLTFVIASVPYFYGIFNNVNVLAADTTKAPCVTINGNKECIIETIDRESLGDVNVKQTSATIVLDSSNNFIGLKNCTVIGDNANSGASNSGFRTVRPSCNGVALKDISPGTTISLDAQGKPNNVEAYQFLTKDFQRTSLNGGKYYALSVDGKYYVYNDTNGNYIILNSLPAGNDLPDNQELLLERTSASQYGQTGTGVNTTQAKALDAAKAKALKIETDNPGVACTKVFLDALNNPVFQCFKDGKAVGADGKTELPAGCVGFREATATGAVLGTVTGISAAACVKESEIETLKTLPANQIANNSAAVSKNPADKGGDENIFQFLFGIVIYIVTLLLWVVNNGLIVALWLLGTMFVFFLRLNPAGAVSGGSVLFEIWRLLYGVANFLVLVSFIWIGFRQILGGSKGQKTSVRKFLQNIIVIALSLNFTILGAATVVNIAQGVGDVALFGYVSVNDYSYLPKSGNDSVDTNAKISAALIGDYIKAVGGASNLHCSVKDKDNQCDTSKLGPEDLASFGNFQQAVDVSGKAFGEKITDFINEFLLFVVLAISIVTVFGRLTWRAIRRIFVLVALMVGSPIILVGFFSDIPQLKSSATGWWKAFISNTLFYPLAVFSLIVSGVFINKFATLIKQVNSTTTSASITSLINPINWVQGFSVVAQDTAAVTTDTTSPLKAYYGIIILILAGVVMYSVALFLDKSTESVSDTVVANFGGLLTGDGRKSSGVGSSLDKDKTSSKPTATGPAAALKSIAGKALVGGAKLAGGIATGGASLALVGGAGIASKVIGSAGGALSTVASKARTLLAGRTVRNFVDKNTALAPDGSRRVNDSVRNLENFRTMMYNFMTLVDQKGGIRVKLSGESSAKDGGFGSSTGAPLLSGPVFPSRSSNSTNSNDNYKAETDRVNTYSQDDVPQYGATRKLNGPAPAGAIDVKAVTVGESIVSKTGGNSNLSRTTSNNTGANVSSSSRSAGVQAALPPSGSTSSSRNNAYAGAQTAYTQSSAQQGNTTIAASPASKASSSIGTSSIDKPQPTVGNYAGAQREINQGAQPTKYSGIQNEPNQSNDSASNSTPSIERSAIAIPSITVGQPQVDASAYKASYTPQTMKSAVESAPETQVSTPTPARTSFTPQPQPQRQSTNGTYTQTIEVPSSPVPDSIPANLSQNHIDTSNAANNAVSTTPTFQSRSPNSTSNRNTTPTDFAGSRKNNI